MLELGAHDEAVIRDVVLELGGNLGACSVELLVRTRASLVIFEPHPLNLFRLTSTLKRLSLEAPELLIAERVVVFPIAVGNESTSAPLFVTKGNLGDSVVGTAVRNQGWRKVHHVPLANWVPIRPLDNLFSTFGLVPGQGLPLNVEPTLVRNDERAEGTPSDRDRTELKSAEAAPRAPSFLPPGWIRLMKLDIQGLECRALAGMAKLLKGRAVKAIKTEVSQPHLEAQGCSEREYLALLRTYFDVPVVRGRTPWMYDVSGVAL